MQRIVAIDAGGTSTRAVIVDPTGRCHGYGFSGGGNPVSAGFDAALTSLLGATEMAQAADLPDSDTISSALIAMAGAGEQTPHESIAARFANVGLHGPLEIESDLLATYFSGTLQPRGYALVAGTGSVAARIGQSRLEVEVGS